MSNLSRFTRLAGVGIVALAAGAFGAAPANAGPWDRTAPVVSIPVAARYVVGGQLAQDDLGEVGAPEYFYDVPVTFSWTGSDEDGWYSTVRAHYDGDEPGVLQVDRATTWTGVTNDYSDEYGGGSFNVSNWSVLAEDSWGNARGFAVYGAEPTITQNDGFSSGAGKGPAATVAYSGTWSSSSCTCFAAGTTTRTTQAGARATITVTVPAAPGESWVGLVMEKAANRGRFTVRVDGGALTTVDTYSATTQHMVIVWQTRLLPGTHTITVSNLATAGRARIDLDAVVTN
ncbi:MAG: hypothetical protein WAW88_16530 [Nocardioides sp.]